jgi:hypothetical protein
MHVKLNLVLEGRSSYFPDTEDRLCVAGRESSRFLASGSVLQDGDKEQLGICDRREGTLLTDSPVIIFKQAKNKWMVLKRNSSSA